MHHCFGHLNTRAVKEVIAAGAIDGLPTKQDVAEHKCSVCALAKSKRREMLDQLATPAHRPHHTTHVDLMGPIQPPSVHKHTLACVFVDSNTSHVELCFLKHKSQLANTVTTIFTEKIQNGHAPRVMFSD